MISRVKDTKDIKDIFVRVGLLTLFLILILGVFMSNVSAKNSSSAKLPDISKLPNGVTLIYQNVPDVGVVTVQSFIGTGSVNESIEISGISHFLEHILFKGTKNFKPGEIDVYLDSLGGENNAFTSSDLTNYYVTIPTKNVEAAFEVVSDMVFNAQFIKDEIEKEKPVVVQEIMRKYNDPSYMMWQDLLHTIFLGTPYEREVIGTVETVNALTQENLLKYYNSYYHPENMFLTVVGDIDKKEVEKLALKYFNQKRDVDLGKRYKGLDKVEFTKSVDKVFTADIDMEYVVLAFPTEEKLSSTIYANEVLSEMLAGGEFSLFNEILKNQKRLVIYTSDLSLNHKYNGLMGAFAVTAPDNADKFRDEALKIIQDIADGKIDDKVIEKAKNRLKSDNIYSYERVSSLANELGYAYTLDMEDYYLNFVNGINAVTKKDLMKYATELLDKPMYYAKTIGKKKAEKGTDKKAEKKVEKVSKVTKK